MPNITGYFISADDNYLTTNACGGAFNAEKSTYNEMNGTLYSAKINFNASLSNAIYGASDTVQPSAITLIPQIKF